MSLINEALKKAQRSRTAGADGTLPPMPGGPIAKRGPARSANMMVLIGSGALVLVVLSVAITVYLVSRPAPPPATSIAARKAAPIVVPDNSPVTVTPIIPAAPTPAPSTPEVRPAAPAPKPVAVAPVIKKPPPAPTPTPNPSTQTATVPPLTAAPRSATPATAQPAVVLPSASPPPAATVTVPIPTAQPDERIAAYIESIRIAGVRATGSDARVLIGERVYKINDIIERSLGVRLVKVAPGVLTFADANGVTYAKNH